jgi:hypothetical protein
MTNDEEMLSSLIRHSFNTSTMATCGESFLERRFYTYEKTYSCYAIALPARDILPQRLRVGTGDHANNDQHP